VNNSLRGEIVKTIQEPFELCKIANPPSITGVRWTGKRSLIACTADGRVLEWSFDKGVSTLVSESGNSYQTIDWAKENNRVVCAGK